MALHRPHRTSEASLPFAGPAVMGMVLAVMLVGGLELVGDGRTGTLLAGSGLGAGILTLSLTGLFACATFATSFVSIDEHPRRGSMRPISMRLRTRRRPARS
jgi:hypothetical protein